ncbi:hypothetical protein CEUSTIGMA_g4377.t1 [Chlamydomonas eustigma]|uniref:procollagen-proline 4-dioxygenase n=1 Tax=Chlamydomonas eustigma TaxID=1157962 RepID=A0A250X2F9_9CHLO|nr:hypothetical protein CEUSTIGMA_g4377.t1 [Chlamydomonas eustigma]|eukprot:GAX76930.1 hypothetical protein CEUSTIGMA_g4377.t1 [Chlamydomonas eustigma]
MGRMIIIVTTLFLVFHLPFEGIAVTEEKLIGWKGETYDPDAYWDPLNLTASKHDSIPLPSSRSWIEIISFPAIFHGVSWQPRAFIYHNFISNREARHLIELAAVEMKRSTVVGEGGKSVLDGYRTSYGTFLRRYQDDVVKRVEHRVAAWTQIPVEHQEDIQVLRYGIGQFYRVHADTLRDPEAGVRVATVLVYLNEPDEGGETAFPRSSWINPKLAETSGPFSDCAKNGVAFKPKRGDALLFWSINPDGITEDFHASHTGCPVISGAKWTMTKWIHAKPFRPAELSFARRSGGVHVDKWRVDPGHCSDLSSGCSSMTAEGKLCEQEKDKFIVSATGLGICRKTCGACKDCEEADVACFNHNREKVGYLSFNASELQLM